jgi:hypothetical protein
VSTCNSLPYIKIQHPPLKLLVDTGCFVSIIRPSVAETNFPSSIYYENSKIKTATGEKEIKFKADIPAFSEFCSNDTFRFLLYDFHDFFDGIIGLRDLLKLKLSIDLTNNRLISDSLIIPLYFRQPDEKSFTFSIDAHEVIKIKLPVDCLQGDIIIPEQKIKDLYVPETLTSADNGFANTEVHNNTSNRITLTLESPIKVINFPQSQQQHFDFFHIDSFLTKSKTIEHCPDVQESIRTEHLNDEEKKTILSLCREFKDIFHNDNKTLTFTNQIKHTIKTTDEIPVHTKSYRYPFVHKAEVAKQIEKMLENGIIRPSQSPWSSPIWIVPKKMDASGKTKWRIVVDYRKINEKTVDDRYPLPNINDILDKLGKCQYFTTLDLASGFHQIEMDPESVPKTAFNVENGHYEYVRMPFGLKNAPATFQRVMDNVLKDLQGKVCLVYMDDIIIFSTSLQEHISNLRLVFEKLRKCKFKIQLDKSEFLRKEVEFLGHVITPDGIKPNPRKIQAIRKFPIPKTARDIKSFLGLLGYYRRFIKNFAKITKPFTQCLKKGEKIVHTPEFRQTFEYCKNILCNEPILQYPDLSKPFVLTTDASNFAIGAVLSQGNIGKDLPVAYASRTLNPAECNYSTIEKELLAIVWATKYFRPYLFGAKFKIVTDHKPLQWLFNLKEPNSRLVRWRLKLEEYDYEILYKKGKHNTNADALSRIEINAVEDDNSSIIVNIGDTMTEISQVTDEYLNNSDHVPQSAAPKSVEPTPSTSKIKIISNVQIKPPDRVISDNETIHSAVENPIVEIPVTDKPLNNYKNQIIINCPRDAINHNVKTQKIFDKTRLIFSIPLNNFETNVISMIKQYLNPKQSYTLFFKTPEIAPRFTKIVQMYFKNTSFKFVKSNVLLTDVIDLDEQKDTLKYYHEGKTCHKGINEMKSAITRNWYWPNMINDITHYVNNCETCQIAKYDRNPPVIKFNLTPTASKPFEQIHIDTFKILNHSFLTILDSFSKYGQAYPITSLNPINIIDALLSFISHHGLPYKITSDCGGEFKNNLLEDFCKLHKIELHYTTPKNSNSNSLVERFHSTLAEEIRCLRLEKPNESTNKLIYYAIIGYNNAIHSVTGYTPFEIVKGHINTSDPFDLNDRRIISNYIQQHKENVKTLYNNIQQKSANKKEQIINNQNANRQDPEPYTPNQTAYIKTKARNKAYPKFVKTKVITDLDKKLTTQQGIYHKNHVKRNRKTNKENLSLQPNSQNGNSSQNPPHHNPN